MYDDCPTPTFTVSLSSNQAQHHAKGGLALTEVSIQQAYWTSPVHLDHFAADVEFMFKSYPDPQYIGTPTLAQLKTFFTTQNILYTTGKMFAGLWMDMPNDDWVWMVSSFVPQVGVPLTPANAGQMMSIQQIIASLGAMQITPPTNDELDRIADQYFKKACEHKNATFIRTALVCPDGCGVVGGF